MKTTFAIASAFIFVAVGAWAQDKKPAAAQQESPKASAPDVEYRPPSRGAPKVRVGGSTRGIAQRLSLAVIAPDHVGLASTGQPDLYWYISRPVESPLEFALYPVDATDPLIEKAIAPVPSAGIQRIRLSELGVKLKPGEEYQWLISFASKPNSRAKEAVASGRVRVQPVTGTTRTPRCATRWRAIRTTRSLPRRSKACSSRWAWARSPEAKKKD
jgi:hypothetical protein